MTDDRHYDLSITIVPGVTAPRKLQLIANIDCPRRRDCPPPAGGSPRQKPAADSRARKRTRRPAMGRGGRSLCSPANPLPFIFSPACSLFPLPFLCFSFSCFPPFSTIAGQSARPRVNSPFSLPPPRSGVETKVIVPLGNNAGGGRKGLFVHREIFAPIERKRRREGEEERD